MTSKEEILRAIRNNAPDKLDVPELDGDVISYEKPVDQFCTVLESVGGRAVPVESYDAISQSLAQQSSWTDAKKTCSLVPQLDIGNVRLDDVDDAHELHDIDFVVAPGQFAIAENGAIWVTGESIKHRSVLFITQHLALVVAGSEIVNNMHEAYDRISIMRRQFGTFISGPSKTADIEQSLVIGAHGPRSLSVFLMA